VKRVLLLLVLLAFVSGASADNYYVSTTGDNGASGDLTHPWQNVSYAADQSLSPGDTVYLFDGTWYSETMNIDSSGNATHPITFTAYNGTPTLDGEDYGVEYAVDIRYGPSYINISGLTITRYHDGIYARESTGIHVYNCTLHNLNHTGVYFYDANTSSIDECKIHNIGWNNVMVTANKFPPENVSITNNELYDNPGTTGTSGHNIIDLFNDGSVYSLSDIDIIGNHLYNCDVSAIFEHGVTVLTMYRINISDNIIHNTASARVSYLRDSIVHNNTVYDQSGYGFQSFTPIDSTTFTENTIYNTTYADIHLEVVPTGEVTFERNNITYYRIHDGTGTIIDEAQRSYDVHPRDSGTVNVEYIDGTVFDRTIGAGSGIYNAIEYYPARSNFTISGTTDLLCTIMAYNITLNPDNAYLKNVTVNRESNSTYDITNITVNSTIADNPTWITATMQNTSNTYNVSIDGVYTTQVVSDSGGIVRYQYTDSWSEHDFEFGWYSSEGWTPSNTAIYFNTTIGYDIEITTKPEGANLFSRTPTEEDGNVTSFNLVVTI